VAAVVVVVAGGVGAALVLSGGEPAAIKATAATTTTLVPTTSTTRLDGGPFDVVTTKGSVLTVYSAPAASSSVVATVPAKTDYRIPATLLVNPDEPSRPAGWFPVTVPFKKPNNMRGWVQAADVTISQTTYAIRVSLTDHTLVLLKSGTTVLTTKVIIGAPATATPVGRFYLTDPLNCNKESVPGYQVAQCSSAYGSFAIGTSGLSEKLDSFDGTMPQIALHGTDLPASSLGQDLSNGCVRMPNDVILQIAQITPLLGTPVTITA
jgi:lipoprotein-anchoring transpeptidase ErfK/SrfK